MTRDERASKLDSLLTGIPADRARQIREEIAKLVDGGGWISVKERLPDPEFKGIDVERDCVLVYWDPASLADYLPNPQVCSILYFLRWSQDAIAWRPLPLLPRK